MNFKVDNGVLSIFLDGRIDSQNADEKEKEIVAIRNENSHNEIVFDAETLEYISSAGLRMVLRTRKSEPTLKIINVSADVYEIFDMTGFTEMLTVEKAYRKFSVDGCEVIGKGAKGIVYRYDPDTIVKVYINPDSLPDIHNERKLARKAFVLGIPTAISYDVVRVGESYGSVFELLDAKSFSKLIEENPDKLDEYVSQFTELLKTIHTTQVKADDMPDIKETIYKWIEMDKTYLAPEQANKLETLVKAVPDTLNMLHCDYHTNNIMMQNGETILIDMDTLSHGHPIFELANIYITYIGFGEVNPAVVENFIGLPYAKTIEIWNKFLPEYLGTTDSAKIKEVEDKVKLLSYVRLLRHTLRRRNPDSLEDTQTLELCKDKISALLDYIDTLEF